MQGTFHVSAVQPISYVIEEVEGLLDPDNKVCPSASANCNLQLRQSPFRLHWPVACSAHCMFWQDNFWKGHLLHGVSLCPLQLSNTKDLLTMF